MDTVEEIKQRLSASEVVGSYVQLKMAGRNHRGICPFHHEKTPSFMVSDEKGIWHCFGCGEGGDIFGFVMKMEGLDFRGALESLGRKAGVAIEDYDSGGIGAKNKEALYKALELATRYYQAALSKPGPAASYVKKRGFSEATIKAFRLGFAPAAGDALVKFASSRGASDKTLSLAGLMRQTGARKADLFRNRLLVPLIDSQDRVVGFTGRVLDDSMPKYLNTPQTLLFDKGRFVFGLNLAKEAIRKADAAVMVEGHLDVIASHQVGVANVVASGGTALTIYQLKQLSRLTKNIKLAFDQDAAGITATERAIPIAQELGLSLFIVKMGTAKDPDELIKQSDGVKAWQAAIKDAPYVVDWLLEVLPSQYDLGSALGKKQLTDRLSSVLSKLTDPVEQDHYVQAVAKLTGVEARAIRRKLIPEDAPAQAARQAAYHTEAVHDEGVAVEEAILAIAVTFPDTRTSLQELSADHFTKPERAQLFEWLAKEGEAKLDKKLPGPLLELESYVKILLLKGEEGYEAWAPLDRRIEAFSLAARLQDIYLRKQLNKINQAIKTAEASGDNTRKLELLKQFRDLARKS